MPQYDDPAPTSGLDLDPNSAEDQGENHPGKKTSFFGKLKDKTRDKVSKIKNRVTKKKSGGSAGDGSTPSESPSESHDNDEAGPDDNDEEEEEEDHSKELPASDEHEPPPAPTTPSITEPETVPASTPLESEEEGQTKSAQEFTPSVDEVSNGQPEHETQTPPPETSFGSDQLEEPEPQTPPESFESDQPEPDTQTVLPPESTTRSFEPATKLGDVDTTASEDPAVPSSGQSGISGYPVSDEPAKLEGGQKFEDDSIVQPQDRSLDQDSSATPQDDNDKSFTDKGTGGAQGLKDTAYGTAGAAAGALGYDKLTGSENTPQNTVNTSQDEASGLEEDAQDHGQQASDQDSSAATQDKDQRYTDKAAEGAQGLKDAAYGTVGAAAGALGYDKLTGSENTAQDSTTPQDDTPKEQEKAQDGTTSQADTPGEQEKAQDLGQQPSDQDSSVTSQDKDQSYTDKETGGAQGLKDAAYGTVGAAAGASGFDKLAGSGKSTPQDTSPPQDETPGEQEKVQDHEQPASDQDSSATTQDLGQQPSDQDSSATAEDKDQSYTDKAAGGVQGLKDAAYGAVTAAAGAVGYDKLTESGNIPQSKDASQDDDTLGVQEKAEALGQQAPNSVTDTASTVSDKAHEGVAQTQEGNPDVPSSATEAAKDSVSGKANDLNNATGDSQTFTQKALEKADQLNNATGDSQTYTEKAAETTAAVTGSIAATLGLDKSSNTSDGTSIADKSKGYLNSAVDTTKAFTQPAAEKSKEVVGAGTGSVQETTGSVADTTKDGAGSAADATKDDTGSVADTTKEKLTSATGAVQDGAQSTVDSSKGYVQTATNSAQSYGQQAVDATKNYTQSATDISKDYASKVADQAAGARDTAVDTVTPKDEHKALSDHVTTTIGNFPTQIKDSVLSTVQGTSPPADAHQTDSPKENGLFGRFTDLIFGKKLPEHDESGKTTTETSGAPPATEEGLSTSEPTSVQQ
ncbi:hypothetical protein CY35_06G138700 [Sphagnum magellanicum]|nr:hypothetical protein CY35_06G138700 [Sphagnum magellanicum]